MGKLIYLLWHFVMNDLVTVYFSLTAFPMLCMLFFVVCFCILLVSAMGLRWKALYKHGCIIIIVILNPCRSTHRTPWDRPCLLLLLAILWGLHLEVQMAY